MVTRQRRRPDDRFVYAERFTAWLRQSVHPAIAAVRAHEEVTLMKHCTMCDQFKDPQGFYPNRSRPDGLSSHCRPCTKAAQRARDTVKGHDRKPCYTDGV